MIVYTLKTAWVSIPHLTAEQCEIEAAELLTEDPEVCIWLEPES